MAVLGVVLLLAGLLAVVTVRLFTDLPLPSWAPSAAGFLAILLLQLVALSFVLVFILVTNRVHFLFLPARDYAIFVDRVESLTL